MTKKMSSVNRPLGYYELDPKFPWTIVSGKCATKLVLYRKLRFSFISAVRSFNYFFVAIIGYPGVFSEHLMLPRVTKPTRQGSHCGLIFLMSRHKLSHKYVATFTPRESWRSHLRDINDI